MIVLAGPTASGKTALAISLSQKLAAPILSADSRQVYRELIIGVARPSAEELAAAPHHLIGYVSIHDAYSAGHWARDAKACLAQVFAESESKNPQRVPIAILAGGSGLHVQALLEGLPEMPPVSAELRAEYDQRLLVEGLPALLSELDRLDPAYGQLVDRANPVRITRALAAMAASGESFTALRARPMQPLPYDVSWVHLDPPREILYPRIDARVNNMLDRGLEAEARQFEQFRALDSLQTIGYREWWPYFDGQVDFASTATAIKAASRAYARRQSTWNRRLPGLRLSSPNLEQVIAYLNQ